MAGASAHWMPDLADLDLPFLWLLDVLGSLFAGPDLLSERITLGTSLGLLNVGFLITTKDDSVVLLPLRAF